VRAFVITSAKKRHRYTASKRGAAAGARKPRLRIKRRRKKF